MDLQGPEARAAQTIDNGSGVLNLLTLEALTDSVIAYVVDTGQQPLTLTPTPRE